MSEKSQGKVREFDHDWRVATLGIKCFTTDEQVEIVI